MNLTVFPYNKDIETIVKYRDMLLGYNVSSISSFKENEYLLDKFSNRYNIHTSTDFKCSLDFSEGLLLNDNIGGFLIDKYYEGINYANIKSKEIFISKNMYNQLNLKELKIDNIKLLKNEYTMMKTYYEKNLFEIPIPIIGVLGLGENCNKFEVQLMLKKVLSEQEYNAVNICSNSLGSLFGMYDIPECLFDKEYTFQEKVIKFNQYVYDICKTQNPDVIILGFPSGIMPLGENDYNYFAEIPLIMANAVNVDIGILNLYFSQDIDNDYLETMKKYCINKFGIPIEGFAISTQKLEYNHDFERFEVHFFDDNLIRDLDDISQHDLLMSLTNIIKSESVIRCLINKLEENLDAV